VDLDTIFSWLKGGGGAQHPLEPEKSPEIIKFHWSRGEGLAIAPPPEYAPEVNISAFF